MNKKRLFIVAGVSGSGKSTLLRLALERGIPIFGYEVNNLFQETRVPEYQLHESEFSFDEHVENKFWFQAMHIRQLSDKFLETVVIHLDLGNILTNIIKDDYYFEDKDAFTKSLVPKKQKNATSERDNEALFDIFLRNRYFNSFDLIYCNTLFATRGVVENNLKSRSRIWYGRKFQIWKPYTNNRSHSAIYNSWARALEKLRTEVNFISQFKDGHLVIDGSTLSEPLSFKIDT
jgi:energy-coupling factor transporter ATP-binding protein EcfA2